MTIKLHDKAWHKKFGWVEIVKVGACTYGIVTEEGKWWCCPQEDVFEKPSAGEGRLYISEKPPGGIPKTDPDMFRHQQPAPQSGYPQMAACLEIMHERDRQDDKWGTPEERAKTTTPFEMCTILGEEFGEMCQAFLEHQGENTRKELIQIAAVAVAMIQMGDAGGWWAR